MCKRSIFLTILVLFIAVSAPLYLAFADQNRESDEAPYHLEQKFFLKTHFLLEHAGELGLSDKQAEKIKDLEMSLKKDFIRKDAEIEILTIDGKVEMDKDPINKDALDKIVDKAYDLKKEKTKSLISATIALDAVLTKEQSKKAEEHWDEHAKEMMAGKKEMMGEHCKMMGKMKHQMGKE